MKIKFTRKNDFRINKVKVIFPSIKQRFLIKLLASYLILYRGNKQKQTLPIRTLGLIICTLYKIESLSPVTCSCRSEVIPDLN
jgi:hypothetical protein